MSEAQFNFLDAIDSNSEKQQNITENEWNKINKDKTQILSKVSDSKKEEFELKYQELDDYFKKEWEQIHQTTVNDLKLFKESFQLESKSNNEVKNELILKYSSEYKNLQLDVVIFLDKAFSNSLDKELWNFNINKFNNKDTIEGFSKYELDQYSQILDKAMNHMNIIWSYDNFKEQYADINEKPNFLSWKWDIALANKIDLQEYILWEWDKHITNNIHDYSEEDLNGMREENFDITDSNKMKNFLVLLWIEFWDWIEDILKFIWNIPAWLIVLPRYINNRLELTDDKVDTKDEVEAQMENDMLLKENPSLILWELLWEQWIQMIKQLWKMFVSWKNWDVALMLVTIAWLVAWWAGVVKLAANWAKMNKVASIAWKVQSKANKVDDIVWWAWLWHISWDFSKWKIDKNIVIENWKLDNNKKLEKADFTENEARILMENWINWSMTQWVAKLFSWFWLAKKEGVLKSDVDWYWNILDIKKTKNTQIHLEKDNVNSSLNNWEKFWWILKKKILTVWDNYNIPKWETFNISLNQRITLKWASEATENWAIKITTWKWGIFYVKNWEFIHWNHLNKEVGFKTGNIDLKTWINENISWINISVNNKWELSLNNNWDTIKIEIINSELKIQEKTRLLRKKIKTGENLWTKFHWTKIVEKTVNVPSKSFERYNGIAKNIENLKIWDSIQIEQLFRWVFGLPKMNLEITRTIDWLKMKSAGSVIWSKIWSNLFNSKWEKLPTVRKNWWGADYSKIKLWSDEYVKNLIKYLQSDNLIKDSNYFNYDNYSPDAFDEKSIQQVLKWSGDRKSFMWKQIKWIEWKWQFPFHNKLEWFNENISDELRYLMTWDELI